VATLDEINAFLASEFPHARHMVTHVGNGGATVVHEIGPEDLRPGGTVSGPTLMAVADVALYAAIFGAIGIVPLAVTTSLTINFLRKPAADRRVVGECKLLKLGKVLAIGDVLLYSEGVAEPVAHVVATYSIPPRQSSTGGGIRPGSLKSMT
jgi:acyl-coenzyme A thioesterase PaaI-like protein